MNWRENFRDNPMLSEALRPLTSLGLGRSGSMKGPNLATWLLIVALFLWFAFLVMRYNDVVHPATFSWIVLILVTLVVPFVLHRTISAERERRSLDILLTTPVTGMQIVVGKASRVLTPIALTFVFSYLLLLLNIVARAVMGVPTWTEDAPMEGVLLFSPLLILATAVGLTGITMAVSAKSRNTTTSLFTMLGLMFVVLAILPMIVASLDPSGSRELIIFFHPYTAMVEAIGSPTRYDRNPWAGFALIFCTGMWILIGILTMNYASRRITVESSDSGVSRA